MPVHSHYSEVELLRDGRRVAIRALRPEDRKPFIAAVRQMSTESLYRRFFNTRQDFSEKEVQYFVNVDFVKHIALIAIVEENGEPVIVGGGRYIVDRKGHAEVAFAVSDRFQGLGIGTILMRHLIGIARRSGLRELSADVLPENKRMLKVFKASGVSMSTNFEPGNVHVTLQI
jgi:GNAT superfamily N-acetyltransferase